MRLVSERNIRRHQWSGCQKATPIQHLLSPPLPRTFSIYSLIECHTGPGGMLDSTCCKVDFGSPDESVTDQMRKKLVTSRLHDSKVQLQITLSECCNSLDIVGGAIVADGPLPVPAIQIWQCRHLVPCTVFPLPSTNPSSPSNTNPPMRTRILETSISHISIP